MIQKEYGGYTLTCDVCGEYEEFDTFDEAFYFMKAHGWRTHKDEYGEWVHECGQCNTPSALEDFT